MSPGLRRACHQALDLVLDALAEEERGAAPPKKRRKPLARPLPPLPPATPEEVAAIEARWECAGFKKSA